MQFEHHLDKGEASLSYNLLYDDELKPSSS